MEWKMITATARKHIVSALRQALRINQSDATAILDTVRNWNMLDLLDGPMHGVIAVVGETPRPSADLYRDEGHGYRLIGSLLLGMDDMRRWRLLDMVEAYEIAAKVAARPYVEPARQAANDDTLRLDASERRALEWFDDAQVCGCENKGTHVELDVMIGGSLTVAVMLPTVNPDMDSLTRYVMEQLGRPGSLLIGRMGDNGIGIDPEAKVVDMILPDDARRSVAATRRNRYAA
jgi:hypothetical protein